MYVAVDFSCFGCKPWFLTGALMLRKLSLSPMSCVNPSTRNSHFEPARYFLNVISVHELTILVSILTCCLCMQLEDGDIVCFQKPTPVENGEHLRYPDVPSFLDYVHNRQVSLPETFTFVLKLLFLFWWFICSYIRTNNVAISLYLKLNLMPGLFLEQGFWNTSLFSRWLVCFFFNWARVFISTHQYKL